MARLVAKWVANHWALLAELAALVQLLELTFSSHDRASLPGSSRSLLSDTYLQLPYLLVSFIAHVL